MAKTLFKAKFKDKLPLGGIATGHIDFGCDGSVTMPKGTTSFFVIKAEKEGQLFDARILQSTQNDSLTLPCFEEASSSCNFPFAEVSLSDSSFPADVKISAFSPFIPLNDTDSGIPGVLFGFEITNTSDERIDFSICGVMKNKADNAFNRMGCTDTGEAYIHLSGNDENPDNVCMATDSKNVSFCEYISDEKDFVENFISASTLFNKTKLHCEVAEPFGALSSHFSLMAGESTRVNFCLSWYCPENEFTRNYYAQYFESSLECASYLFRQKERLYGDSLEFCENIFASSLPENVMEEVGHDLFSFLSSKLLRLDDGALISQNKEKFTNPEDYITRAGILTTLFPNMEYSETEHFYKKDLYESADDEKIIMAILSSYRRYILCADDNGLIEDWYYIAKCAEKLFGEDCTKKPSAEENLISVAVHVLSEMAEAVRDKKRAELYSTMSFSTQLMQVSMDITKGFARINEVSGFQFNAVEKHIGFYPQSDHIPVDDSGTFRCFFCTPSGFGYVEEGIDYIEINLLKGVMHIRSFGVPRTPRLVQYGGRNWRFTDTGTCALLDSDLEITPQKKLTIFIDIKQ